MKCESPLDRRGMLLGCGDCIPCRVNRARMWAHRLELEAGLYEHNAFLTLTYDDAHLPKGDCLEPKALQGFVKRLRRYHDPIPLRVYAVGEYGDLSGRPHYHAILFNFGTCLRLETRYGRDGKIDCCPHCQKVEELWQRGRIQLARVSQQSVRYVTGYMVKKMTHRLDPRLHGREPEFSRMSLRPGIGYHAIEKLNDQSLKPWQHSSPVSNIIVSSISYGPTKVPLGRYLTKRLKQLRGQSSTKLLTSRLKKYDTYQDTAMELHDVRTVALTDQAQPSYITHYKLKMAGKFASQQARLKIKQKVKVL